MSAVFQEKRVVVPAPVLAPAPAARTMIRAATRRLVSIFDTLALWQWRHQQRLRLSSLDDHMLRDMGLSRADVEHESGKPVWRR
ncbi:MAG: DUF1127 domain-containing protein [Azospirillaceae bacterium]|nr:DUF1127 domain-containing protein [Azospirillaceae bacterium]